MKTLWAVFCWLAGLTCWIDGMVYNDLSAIRDGAILFVLAELLDRTREKA
jgi:hypothetical protein